MVLVVVAGAAVSGAGPPSAASASTPSRPSTPPIRYDVALGDSLAAGIGASRPADSYVHLVFRDQRLHTPGLQLVNLACSGATTATLLHGGGCRYPAGSQLAAAESFLRLHRGRIAFVTIDIGINDIDGCVGTASVDAWCVTEGLRQAGADLAGILAGLRAADEQVAIYGADYYDPFLAAWSEGATGRAMARQTEEDVLALDDVLARGYAAFGVPVAQVAARFDTVDFGFVATPSGTVPANVERVCAWTWMCSSTNLHPDDLGHTALAAAFDQVIDAGHPDPRSSR
jgi:lysophospholipase L1-like esterase